MKATRDLKNGDVIFSIPFSLLMSVETATQSPLNEVFSKMQNISR